MRFYANGDANIFWEFNSWNLYARTPNKSWKSKTSMESPHIISYWRDLKGAKMESIKRNDLPIKNWSSSRIRPEACLPLYYGVGQRFIRLEKSSPAGFKCTEMPLNLQEAREIKGHYKQLAKEEKRRKKEQQSLGKSKKQKNRFLKK
ncbi:uncharacterized protein LOC131994827 [Stomoxys calcitrans]|uniref:uncharacterized protein LOC131994827 n=1 Tax=Stomoxys calcitrans TaxID=35570 RepID=UPI0027E225C5|nr:uncharacterized protein LOC131994827 [Stomoxys calcitrans]